MHHSSILSIWSHELGERASFNKFNIMRWLAFFQVQEVASSMRLIRSRSPGMSRGCASGWVLLPVQMKKKPTLHATPVQ